MRKTLSAVLAAIAAIGFAGGAMAQETTIAVPYADLDLSSEAGSAALESRISAAATAVCNEPFIRDLKAMKEFESCKAEARANAMQQISWSNAFEGMELASIF